MRKSVIIAAIGLILLLVLCVGTIAEGKRRAEVCLDRGMVVVDTSAGGRCAAPDTLERI